MTEYLTTESLLVLCEELGGLKVADLGLLDSAAHRPSATFFGEDAYPDLPTKAAALLQSIVRNPALVDGNKRLAWTSARVFLLINGHQLEAPDDDAYDLVIGAATGALGLAEIAKALNGWIAPGART